MKRYNTRNGVCKELVTSKTFTIRVPRLDRILNDLPEDLKLHNIPRAITSKRTTSELQREKMPIRTIITISDSESSEERERIFAKEMHKGYGKLFICSICDHLFNVERDYQIHVMQHRPGESVHSLLSEESSLSNGSPKKTVFSGSRRGQKCSTRNNLNRHVEMVNNNKPFSCSICGRAFARKFSLKKHLSNSHNEEPFCCSVCKLSFSRLVHLKRHLMVHRDVSLYSCSVCDKSFTTKRWLDQHVAKVHNINLKTLSYALSIADHFLTSVL